MNEVVDYLRASARECERQLLTLAHQIGRAQAWVDLHDAGTRDAEETLTELRETLTRMASTVRGRQ